MGRSKAVSKGGHWRKSGESVPVSASWSVLLSYSLLFASPGWELSGRSVAVRHDLDVAPMSGQMGIGHRWRAINAACGMAGLHAFGWSATGETLCSKDLAPEPRSNDSVWSSRELDRGMLEAFAR